MGATLLVPDAYHVGRSPRFACRACKVCKSSHVSHQTETTNSEVLRDCSKHFQTQNLEAHPPSRDLSLAGSPTTALPGSLQLKKLPQLFVRGQRVPLIPGLKG
jgi:hypothetical protein